MNLNDKFDRFIGQLYVLILKLNTRELPFPDFGIKSEKLIADFHNELTKYQPKPNTLKHPWRKQIYAEVNKKK